MLQRATKRLSSVASLFSSSNNNKAAQSHRRAMSAAGASLGRFVLILFFLQSALLCVSAHSPECDTIEVIQAREATDVVTSIHTLEGAGFPVARPFPTRSRDQADPFLLLDHFGPIKYGPGEAVGAPWHPHRGFETVSYILAGEMQHRDSLENKGSLRAGDVQWMTAGSGIIHDEEPSEAMKKLGGTFEGFQIWVKFNSWIDSILSFGRFRILRPKRSYSDITKLEAAEDAQLFDTITQIKVWNNVVRSHRLACLRFFGG